MSYQQTTENDTYPRSAAMYNLPQSRTSYTPGQGQSQSNENLPMNAMLNQFASMSLPTAANSAANGATAAASQFYMTADGQCFMAPAGMCKYLYLWVLSIADYSRSYPTVGSSPTGTTPRNCLQLRCWS